MAARPGGALSACPAQAGLRAFGAAARAEVTADAKDIDAQPLWHGLRLSDRAWWGGLYTDQYDGMYQGGRHAVVSVGQAGSDPYAAAVEQACGAGLLARSLAVVVGPSAYSGQVSHLFFLDRDGHALHLLATHLGARRIRLRERGRVQPEGRRRQDDDRRLSGSVGRRQGL